eukprot:Amastigsp_a843149_83.p2 type:complete len:173 gc:universal Amastigsp_a843149_83:1-519(+)
MGSLVLSRVDSNGAGATCLVDWRTGAVGPLARTHKQPIAALGASADGLAVVSVSKASSLARVRRVDDAGALAPEPHTEMRLTNPGPALSICVAPNGAFFAVSLPGAVEVFGVNPENRWAAARLIGVGQPLASKIVVSPTPNSVVATAVDSDGALSLRHEIVDAVAAPVPVWT